jgi:hypothetical protein
VAFPSLDRESLVLRPEGRLNLTTTTADCAYPPSSGSPFGPVSPSGRNSNPDFPVQPRQPLGAERHSRRIRYDRQENVSAGRLQITS